MIENSSPIIQTCLGTLLTWFVTSLGSAFAILSLFVSDSDGLLLVSLGFASGVMLAASYWSLLAPAVEIASDSPLYGPDGQWAFVPVVVGFLFGCIFVYLADRYISTSGKYPTGLPDRAVKLSSSDIPMSDRKKLTSVPKLLPSESHVRQRRVGPLMQVKRSLVDPRSSVDSEVFCEDGDASDEDWAVEKTALSDNRWRRVLLLIIAITVHNIPEGLAVGVGFAAIGQAKAATFQNARNLAIGIAIQNFPEGLAVSLPMVASGYSLPWAIFYGQLSGMVEPFAGLLGALLVSIMEPALPYALAFAAGAMIYVVFDDLLPEMQSLQQKDDAFSSGGGRFGHMGSWSAVFGFIVMMTLDVALG